MDADGDASWTRWVARAGTARRLWSWWARWRRG